MNGWLSSVAEAMMPWKEVLGSAFAALAAVGALVSGIVKQRRRTDATFDDAPAPATRPATVVRLHIDDREFITEFRSVFGDLRESVEDLTRVTRLNTKATEDNTDGGGRGGGRGRRP